MTYAERKQSLELKLTALDTDHGFSVESDYERDILPTYQSGTREHPNRTPKPKVPLEDLTYMNRPHTVRQQKAVKAMWAAMSPEQLEAERAKRRANAKATVGHKRIEH